MKRQLQVATAVSVGGAVLAAVSLFLPWARSGRATRTGFELARTVDALGLADSVPLRALLVAFWLLPVLAAVCWTAAAMSRKNVVVATAAGAGLVVGAGAVLVLRQGALHARLGLWVAMVAAATALAGSLRLATTTRERHG